MKNNLITGLCVTAIAALYASAPAVAEAPVIHGNIVGPAAWVDYTSGIYSFKAESPVTLNLEKESLFISVNGGGDILDGLYHYVSNNDGLGELYNYRMYVYDADTWIPKNNFRVPGNYNSLDFATDPATRRFYGTFTTDGKIYLFGWMDPATAEFTSLRLAGTGYPVVGINRYGAVYAIDYKGDLLSVNTSTGVATKLYSTGLSPVGLQTGCFDPCGSPDILYWCYRDSEDETYLYQVDVTKNSEEGVTCLGAFPEQEIVTGAYIRPAANAYASAPAAIADLKAVPAGKQTRVTFTMPAVTEAGESLQGGSVSYVMVTDGIMPQTQPAAQAGQSVTLNLDLADGEHTVTVTPVCGTEAGKPMAVTFIVGADTPAPVTELAASRDGNNFVANWVAPTEGVNGGTIHADALSYEVKFVQGSQSTVETVTECSFTKPVDSATPVNCYVEVTVVDGKLKSETVVSSPVMMGKGLGLPYSNDFSTTESATDFMAWDANGDNVTWMYEYIFEDMRTNYKYTDGDMDDWMFTPIFALDTDYFYHLKFDSKTAGIAYEEQMEVKAGRQRNPDAMTEELMPVTTFVGSQDKSYNRYFTVSEAGNWTLGFHSVTKGNNFYIAVDNLSLTVGGKTSAPAAVQEPTAIPDATGALKCTLKFKAPATDIRGRNLEGKLGLRVSRNGMVIKELSDITPGAEMTLENLTGKQGVNTYELTFSNGDGDGMPASVETYLGVDLPEAPSGVAVTFDSKGNPVVSWEAPVKGVNGGIINPAGLTFSVRRAYDKQFILEDGKALTAVDRLGLEYADQAIMYYEVYATNAAGTSAPATSPHFIMGTPYLMPFYDSFKDATEMQGPWLGLLLDNPEGAWYLDSEGMRPACDPIDGDGGLLTFAPYEKGHTSSVATPLVKIDDAEYPTLEVFVICSPDNDSRLDISVRTAKTEQRIVRSLSLDDSSMAPGWNLLQIPLIDFKGEDYVQVIFTATAGESDNNHVTLDHIDIFDIPRYDVAAALLEAPEEMTVGRETSFFATVSNVGVDPVENIELTLLRDGTPVSSYKLASLASGASHTVGLKDTADLSFADVMYYTFKVSAPQDKNADNDVSAMQEVPVALPHYPAPVLSGSVGAENAELRWVAPDCKGVRAPVTDGFETYDAFIIDHVGDWTMVDIDGNPGTTGILDGNGNPIEYENAGAKMAFQVFNPGLLDFPLYDEDGNRSMYAAHRGQQMMCAFCDLDGYNNDWLISPLLPGQEQTVSFYAKSYSSYYGLEAFIIMATKGDGTDTKDFYELTQVVNAPADWTRYEVTLPAGTRRFAIRCISIDQFALCVDDVKFVPESSPAEDLELTGYKIYRDNELAVTLPASATEWSCPMTGADTDVQFRISAVYTCGESVHSNPVVLSLGVENVAETTVDVKVKSITGGISVVQPDNCEARIYTVDGAYVAHVMGTGTASLSAGIYVVKTVAGAVKVAVR
ncbi:MAG: choice-of-anchor J domain-containing protein [Muribaculaceae bacterium]|nr:choice-of-anchor J domain-containing protein [Muribaculaceae bacterium]